jgi:excisionase family DNA binding protein
MDKVVKGFFWVAFAAFLGASIPHVAYFFRAFEPPGGAQDYQWWGVAYAIAASIDVTIFLLSLTVARMHRRGNAGGLIASVWVFIIGLTALSWYINFKYAQHFQAGGMVSATPVYIPYLGTIADINPLIASMFQVLAVAYTWISDKITADVKPKTAAELKAEADELENKQREMERLKTLKRGGNVGTLKGLISATTEVVKHAQAAVKDVTKTEQSNATLAEDVTQQNTDENTDQNAQDGAGKIIPINRQDADTLAQQNAQDGAGKIEDEPIKNSEQAPTSPIVTWNEQGKVNTVQFPGKAPVHVHSTGTEGGRTLTIKEAAERLGLSVSYVRDLRDNGTLKRSPRNKNLLLKNNVEAYYTRRQNMPINGAKDERNTEALHVLKITQDAQENAP